MVDYIDLRLISMFFGKARTKRGGKQSIASLHFTASGFSLKSYLT